MDRREFFIRLAGHLSSPELRLVQNAYWLAEEVHHERVDKYGKRHGLRDTGEGSFEHCGRVALTLIDERGIYDAEVIATAFLHDVIEDTFTPPDVLLPLFGPKIYEWISTLSKNFLSRDYLTGEIVADDKKSIAWYFANIAKAPWSVRMVKCSDRLDNVRTLGVWDEERKLRYVLETQKYVLPIAEATDKFFVTELMKRCAVPRP